MIKFFKTRINWKTFMFEMFLISIFFCCVYFSGKNHFPHAFWTVPIGTIAIGIFVLCHVYLNAKIHDNNKF